LAQTWHPIITSNFGQRPFRAQQLDRGKTLDKISRPAVLRCCAGVGPSRAF